MPIEIKERLKYIIEYSWELFKLQSSHHKFSIYKEASMQLHFSSLIKILGELMCISPEDEFKISLEKTINYGDGKGEIDIFCELNEEKVGIELKCFRKLASSGKPRGAQDISMRGVFEDIGSIEKLIKDNKISFGFAFVMTDDNTIVNGKHAIGAMKAYSIKEGRKYKKEEILDVPIGKSKIKVGLDNDYEFNWDKKGDFYFLKEAII